MQKNSFAIILHILTPRISGPESEIRYFYVLYVFFYHFIVDVGLVAHPIAISPAENAHNNQKCPIVVPALDPQAVDIVIPAVAASAICVPSFRII